MKNKSLSSYYFRFQKSIYGMYQLIICLIIFLFVNNLSYSQNNNATEHVIQLSDIKDGVKINDKLLLYKDKTRKLGIKDVEYKEFEPNEKSSVNLGYNNDADWIKFNVYNKSNKLPTILKIDKLLIDSITLYNYNKRNGKWDIIHGGASVPRHHKPIPGYSTYFPIHIRLHDTTTFYLRCVSPYANSFSISIIHPPLLHHGDMISSLYMGLFIGILVAITLYNLFLGFSIKDKLYFHYALANLFSLLGGIATEGFFAYYLSGRFTALVPYVTSLSIGLYSLFSCNFSIRFLELKKYSRFALYLMISTAFFVLATTITFNLYRFIGKPMHGAIINVNGFIFSVVALIAGIIAWKKGSKYARFYLIAWAAVFLGLFVLSLTFMGYIPKNVFTRNFYLIGVSLEVLLLSFALADRYNFIQKEKNKLELELQYKTNDLAKVVTDNRMRHSFKQNLIEKLKGIYKNENESIKQELGGFITDLNIQLDADEKRNQLQENIEKINTGFEKKLKERFPKLTKSEIEICGYLKLNLSIKEIANLRNTSITTVKVAKHRINKKMLEAGISIDEMIYED